MDTSDPEHIKKLIRKHLAEFFEQAGVAPESVGDDDNLYANGILDSYGTVEVLMAVEEDTGISADLTQDTEPDDNDVMILSISRIATFFSRPGAT